MGAHFNGQIRLGSVVDNFSGPGATEYAIRLALGPIPPLEGSVGLLRWEPHRRMAHSHDARWGIISIWGDLLDFTDLEAVEVWWLKVIGILERTQGLNVDQGFLQVSIDGKGMWYMDHGKAFEKLGELVGEE